jgi:TRAP-type C4-dicarboxylate transport system permease small subunit
VAFFTTPNRLRRAMFCFRCVSVVVFKCFICMLHGYILMLLVYVSSVSNVSSDVAYVAIATNICFKCIFTCFICFRRMFQTHVSCVSSRCCNDYTSMF